MQRVQGKLFKRCACQGDMSVVRRIEGAADFVQVTDGYYALAERSLAALLRGDAGPAWTLG